DPRTAPVRQAADGADHAGGGSPRRRARRRRSGGVGGCPGRRSGVDPARGTAREMSVFVDENTKVVYQGLTGGQGSFYGPLNRDYGTQVVGGTNPKKAGTDVAGIPVFASVADAVAETGANASCIFIPAAGVRAAVLEAAEAGIPFIVCIT